MEYVQGLPEDSDFSGEDLEEKVEKEAEKFKSQIAEKDLKDFKDTLVALFTTVALAPRTFGNGIGYLVGGNKFKPKDAVFCTMYAAANYSVGVETRVENPRTDVYSKEQFMNAASLAYDYAAQVVKNRRILNKESPSHAN